MREAVKDEGLGPSQVTLASVVSNILKRMEYNLNWYKIKNTHGINTDQWSDIQM